MTLICHSWQDGLEWIPVELLILNIRDMLYQSSPYSPAVFYRMACHSALLLLQCRILDSESHGKVTLHGEVTNCAQLEESTISNFCVMQTLNISGFLPVSVL
jgi:hypothetical protein